MISRNTLFHILFWLGTYILWVAVFRTYSYPISKTMTIEFCYLIFITIDYYVINAFIVPRFLQRKRYAIFAMAIVLTIAVSALLRSLLALQVSAVFFHTSSSFDFQTLLVNSLFNISIWVLAITAAKMLVDKSNTQMRIETLEKERVKSELDFLKAQINPHSLFNSLNTIYGQIDKRNQTARNILLNFSDLLRYQLYECGEERVSLTGELDYLKRYIEFHRCRKDSTLIVDLQIEAAERGAVIAPLLLVVLVENAFKFAGSNAVQHNRIGIHVLLRENHFRISVMNTKETGTPVNTGTTAGIGLTNLKRRLSLLYKSKHELTISDSESLYEAQLTLDLS